jgi:hypothetical protein
MDLDLRTPFDMVLIRAIVCVIDFGAIGRPRDSRAHGAVDVERYSAVGHGLVSAMAV